LIAAIADRHFHVSKQVIGDRTQVQIRLLELEERKKELAQIASGKTIEEGKNQGKGKKEKGKSGENADADGVGGQAIAFAESLLEQAAVIKSESPLILK
jgi:DNA repair protein RecN (Recombination protein N)